MLRISRAQMLYLRESLPDVGISTVNLGKKKGARHYYVEPSDAVIRLLDEKLFWEWYRNHSHKRKIIE